MRSPIMCTEAALLFDPVFPSRPARECPAGKQFETFAAMQGADIGRLDATVLHEAADKCARCASGSACRQWLRTGKFQFDGDPRCPNIALLHD